MIVIKEWYGVCFPPMQFHNRKQFMFDDDENYGEMKFTLAKVIFSSDCIV